MSAAVVGVKRSIEECSDFSRKKSRCAARYDGTVLGGPPEESMQGEISMHAAPTRLSVERSAASEGYFSESNQEVVGSPLYEVCKRFPRVPVKIIQSIVEVTKGNVSETCHMLENLTGAATGCRWAADSDRSLRTELPSGGRMGRRPPEEPDAPGHTSMEEVTNYPGHTSTGQYDAEEESMRNWAQKMVSNLQGSNSVEDATNRMLPLLREFKHQTTEGGVARFQLDQEVRNLRQNQQLCARALKAQQEKIQALTVKCAQKAEKEKELDASLNIVKDENRKLRRVNQELQFFLSSTNNATSEHIFSVRHPDVY